MATSGKAWRSGVEIEFPSGNVARLRPFGAEVLLNYGKLPNILTPVVAEMVEGKFKGFNPSIAEELNLMLAFIDCICRYSFIEPRVVDNPRADDEISVLDIDFQDKMFLLNLINRPAGAMLTFRPEQAGAVGTVDESTGNENPAA